MHNMENTYHIISKLILSVKNRIKQFYFINKYLLRKIIEEEEDEEIEEVRKIPKKLKASKARIMNSKELIQLLEIAVYFIKILKDEFEGQVESKLFNKLIEVPKMIVEVSWYYVFIFYRKTEEYT